MANLTGSETMDIDAPIERCWATAVDVEGAVAWQGTMKKAHVRERDPEGRPTLVDAELDALVARLKVTLRFSYDPPARMRWTRASGDLKSLEGEWHFEDLGGGRTRATYSLDIGLNRALALLRRGVRGAAEQKVRDLLACRPVRGLKEQVEAGR